MTELVWKIHLAISPLWAQRGQFFTYLLLLIFMGLSILGLILVQDEITRQRITNEIEANGGHILIDAGYADFQAQDLSLVENIATASTQEAQFRSMLQVETDAHMLTQLALIRAVDANYPLRGHVKMDKTIAQDFQSNLRSNGNGQYGLLLTETLANYFELEIGATISVAGIEFEYRGIILQTPDQSSNNRRFISYAYIAHEALAKIQEGNLLANHRLAFLAQDASDLDAIKSSFQSQFRERGWQITTSKERADRSAQGAKSAQSIATFFALLAILGFGVTLFNLTRTYLIEDRVTRENLFAMGAKRWEIASYYFIRLAFLLAFTILLLVILGLLLGGPISKSAIPALENIHLIQAITRASFILIPLSIFIAVSSYTLNITPKNYSQLLLLAFAFGLAAWFIYSRAGLNAEALYALIGLFVLAFLYWLSIHALKWVMRKTLSPNGAFSIALLQFSSPRSTQENFGTLLFLHATILAAFLAVITGVEHFVDDIKSQDYPSHYIADIQPDQYDGFIELLETNQASNIHSRPLLLARIDQIEGEIIKNNDHWALRNDLIFGVDNQDRFKLTQNGENLWDMSMDGELASELALSLGDMLSISSIGQPIKLEIKSLHEAEISANAIDFLFYLPNEILEVYPHSFLVSADFPEPKSQLYRHIVDYYPNALVISSAPTISRIESLFDRLLLSLGALGGYISFTALLAALSAASLLLRRERYENAIFHALGLSQFQANLMQFIRISIHFLLIFFAVFAAMVVFHNLFASQIADLPISLDIQSLALISLISVAISILIPLLLFGIMPTNRDNLEKSAQDFQSLELDF